MSWFPVKKDDPKDNKKEVDEKEKGKNQKKKRYSVNDLQPNPVLPRSKGLGLMTDEANIDP